MSTEEWQQFDLNDFYEVLMSIDIKQKLKPFTRQIKRSNVSFIYETINNIIQILNSKQEMPLMKFNALMATKLFFDTGQYVTITLIEIYLLPMIYDIATYRIQKRSEEGLTQYFIEKGYDATKQMKRIGFNFVLLAVEFIFMTGLVKVYRNLENQELEELSNYAKLSKLLLEKGCQPVESYKFYLPSYATTTRKRFLKRLSNFNSQNYQDFYLKLTCDQLNLNKKPEMDMKKMMAFGDAYYTIPLMNICEEELCSMETNFVNKKKYLALIGEFMKAGDIYAVFILTRSPFLEEIYERIAEVQGQRNIEVGAKIYPDIQAPKADKKEFYIQFLKHIEVWAYCHPFDEDGESTDSKKIFDILKQDKKFIFPANILQEKIRSQMELNLKANQVRNEKMIKLVDDLGSSQSKRRNNISMGSSSKISISRRHNKTDEKSLNSYIEFEEVEDMVLNVKKKLDLITEKQRLAQTMMTLQKFKKFWDNMENKHQIDAEDSDDVGLVLEQGSLCHKIIEMILPVYALYSKEAISFEQYSDRVNLLMKSSDIDEPQQTVSISKNIPSIAQVSSKKEESVRLSYLKSQSQSQVKPSGSNFKRGSKISSSYISQDSEQYNDYGVGSGQNQKLRKGKGREKKEDQSNLSVFSSRSGRSSRNSRVILQRRNNNSKLNQNSQSYDLPQPQYRDIIVNNNNKKLEDILTKNYDPKDSFISSEHSSVKENNSHLVKKDSEVEPYESGQRITPIVNQDYYGQLGQLHSNNSLVAFTSSAKSSSKINPKSSKNHKAMKQSQSSRKKGQRQGSVVSEDSQNSLSNTFKIQEGQKQSSRISEIKSKDNHQKESGFSFTSKNEKNQELQESIVARYNLRLKDSQIIQPELQPQLHSYHEPNEESELMSVPSKLTSFKDCFSINNDIMLPKQSHQKMFKPSKGKYVNFIQTVYSKTPRNSSIVDMLSERGAKQSIESYHHQKMKSKAIETHSEKGKSIDSFNKNKNMRMKLVLKKQQFQAHVKVSESNESQPAVSFVQESQCGRQRSEANLNLGLNTVSNQFLGEVSKGRIINTSIYTHYFPHLKSDGKLQKCMLKSKAILLKNNQFQIGYVCTKKQHILQICLFVTPLIDSIEDINLSVAHDQNVKVKLAQKFFQTIKVNCQQVIIIHVAVENVPFVMPSVDFKFKKNQNYALNHMILTVPCNFNKFCDFHKFSGQVPIHLKAVNTSDRVRIEPFKYSPRFLNHEKVKENLNNFSVSEQHKHWSVYNSEVYFKGKIFLVELMLDTAKGQVQLSGANLSGEHKDTKFLEFVLISFYQIFKSGKQR